MEIADMRVAMVMGKIFHENPEAMGDLLLVTWPYLSILFLVFVSVFIFLKNTKKEVK